MEGYKNRGTEVDVQWWMRQLRIAMQFRRVAAYEDRWNDWRAYYRGNWNDRIMPSNIFFKMVRTVVPRIYFRNPSVSITSRRGGIEGFAFAKLVERTDNKLIKTMRIKENMKRQIQNTWMFGTGIGKLGFGTLFHATPEAGNFVTEQPTIDKGREKVEYDWTVQRNMPWYKSCQTGSYLVPSGTIYKEDARWECFCFERPLSDVQADPRLKNTKKLVGAITLPTFPNNRTNTEIARPVNMCAMMEIRDKKTGKVFILSPSLNDNVLFMADDGFMEMGIDVGKPMIFNDDDEYFWGVPDSKILEPQQLEINDVRTNMMYHRRLSILKILAQKGKISKEDVNKLLSEDIAAVAWVNGDPQTAIKTMDMSNIPQGLMQMEQIVQNDLRETVGFSRNDFGEFRPGREAPTATEVNKVDDSSGIRVDERRDMVSDVLVSILNDTNKLCFRHWNKEQVEVIVGPGGVRFWIAFRPSMLGQHQYEINIDPDSQGPETKDVRTQRAVQMYGILKDNPMVDPQKLTQHLLREFHGVAFDDMMMGLPGGAGMSPQNPLSVGQFGQVMNNLQRRAPQLLSGPGMRQPS